MTLQLNECYKWQAQLEKRTGLTVEAPRPSSGSALSRLRSSPELVPPSSHTSNVPHTPGGAGALAHDPVLELLRADPRAASGAPPGLAASPYDGTPDQLAPVHTRSRSQPTANGAHCFNLYCTSVLYILFTTATFINTLDTQIRLGLLLIHCSIRMFVLYHEFYTYFRPLFFFREQSLIYE